MICITMCCLMICITMCYLMICITMCCLRDWSRSGGSYGNNTRVICCRNSRPTVINPDYNMTKQRYITRIYDKIRSKPPPNRATSPTCLHCDVTHLSLTTGVVAFYSMLVVFLPMPCWGCRVKPHGTPSLATVHFSNFSLATIVFP